MQFSKTQLGSIALVVALVLSVTGGALAATVDTETTVTSTTSELVDSDVVDNYDGGAIVNGSVEASVTSTDPAFRVIDPETGVVVETIYGDELNQTGTSDSDGDGTTDTWYYRTNISDALDKMPINSGESKDVTIRIVDNRTVADDQETYTDLNITLDGVKSRAVFRGTATTVDLTTESFLFWSDSKATFEESDVGVNGSGSVVELRVVNTSRADEFATAAEGKSSGDWIWSTQLWINESPHKVYYDAAPDGVDSSATYGVYHPTSDTITAHIGDEYDGESAVDVRMVGNEAYGTITRLQNFGITNALGSLVPF